MAPKMKMESSSIGSCEKRKASESPESITEQTSKRRKFFTKSIKEKQLELEKRQQVKWDVSMELASEILDDMGVAVLSDYTAQQEPTPSIYNFPVSPKAPKMLQQQSSNSSTTVTCSTPVSKGLTDDFVLYRRNKSELYGGKDYFMDLSDEILLFVFKFLPKTVLVKCAQVCKRWLRLAYDETLWRRLDLGKKHLSPGVLGRVIGRGVTILKVSMAEIREPIFDYELPLNPSKLQYLDLSMASIPENALSDLLSTCIQLKKLSLEHCAITDEACRYIGSNKDLECLNMSMCTNLSETGLSYITSGCLRLEAWNLAWTSLNSDMLDHLADNMPRRITHLNIAGCKQALDDKHVASIVERCRDLTVLDLSDATVITGASIESIVKHLTNLQHLHMSRCYSVPLAFYLLLNQIPVLRNLELFCVSTDEILKAVRRGMPNTEVNRNIFSTVARPTTGLRRSTIWGLKVRDTVMG